jgi:hypothetical protein
VPRLSLWKDGKHTNDYKFFDRRMSEMFFIGGTSILIHKYLGPATSNQPSSDATKPSYTTQSELNIQDLLFLENRDRKYDTSVYSLRGVYTVNDSDFDLTQFGLFLQTGTLFMSFHLNDMIQTLGRKIMNGDVLELVHLTDYETLNPDLPAALKRFFVVSDCTRSAEGFSATWWPHIWRVKMNPLVDSQEYKDILKNIKTVDTDGDGEPDSTPLADLLSTYDRYKDINNAIIEQAEIDVPKSGYDVNPIYHVSKDEKLPDHKSPDYSVKGYLSGDGLTPNGLPMTSGISFPAGPAEGDYCSRVDYMPNRLFRYDGRRWIKIEDAVRTNLTNGVDNNKTLRNSFVNNTNTFTDANGNVQKEKQNLNDVLRPTADYK